MSLSLKLGVCVNFVMEPTVVFGGSNLCLIQSLTKTFWRKVTAVGFKKKIIRLFKKKLKNIQNIHKNFGFKEITARLIYIKSCFPSRDR